MILSEQQIREIAEDLDMGLSCIYHVPTGTIKTLPGHLADRWFGVDPEPYLEILEHIHAHREEYREFYMSADQSLQIMTEFAESATKGKLRKELQKALTQPNPVRNFNHRIDLSESLKKEWTTFKAQKNIEFVKTQIEIYFGHHTTE